MSSPAGWYPQSDGQQRYWDGELWTEHFAPGVPGETIALSLLETEQPASSRGRSVSKAALFGWGGLALVALIGAMSSGFSGFAIMLGLFVLVVGAIALARGRVGWAQLGSRAAGGVAVGAAFIFFIVGAVAAPPIMSPTSESTAIDSETATAADAAAAAAAAETAAAETAAAELAASEAAAAADKVAAQATADAAAAQALVDAAAVKAAADATAARKAKAAAATQAKATAARRAKAAAATQAKATAARRAKAAAAAAEPPPAQEVYYDNCSAVRAAGADPIHRGDPGYASHLDRDDDGIGCE